MTKGLLVSAPASRSGKTTLTLGLLAALRARGLAVQPFKCGPDYIDPAFHTAAAGRVSLNLDSWAMSIDVIAGLACAAQGADLALAEGAMGLFDGVSDPGEAGTGTSADIAALMGWPVVLVLDVSGQAQSAAAVAHGFSTLYPDVRLAGVVLNKVASPRHERLLRAGMKAAGIAVLGALPRQAQIVLPERHLGLVQAEELAALQALLETAGQLVADHCDLDAMLAAAQGNVTKGMPPLPPLLPPPGERIALAQDAAFSFLYPHVLNAWHAGGATVLPFSPLADEAPDSSANVCWLPGGYPELHAGRLSGNRVFLDGVRAFARTHPVHGECGGYMVLGAGIEDAQGGRHPMLGLLGLATSFAKRRLHLGYRRATLESTVPGLATGRSLRGHEFHYASIQRQPDAPLARVTDATGKVVPETGSWRETSSARVSGSFFHLIAEAET